MVLVGAVPVLVVLTTLLAAPARAQTDDEVARARFEQGRDAFGGGRYEEAVRFFEVAYELSGRGELLYNIGQCYDRLRRDADAIDAFERYLAEDPRAPNRADVEARIAVLRAQSSDDDGSVLEEWWFWTAIGAVVAGVAVTLVLVLGSEPAQEPPPGDLGVVYALEW